MNWLKYPIAPLITMLSYRNNKPPKVETLAATTSETRECAELDVGSGHCLHDSRLKSQAPNFSGKIERRLLLHHAEASLHSDLRYLHRNGAEDLSVVSLARGSTEKQMRPRSTPGCFFCPAKPAARLAIGGVFLENFQRTAGRNVPGETTSTRMPVSAYRGPGPEQSFPAPLWPTRRKRFASAAFGPHRRR